MMKDLWRVTEAVMRGTRVPWWRGTRGEWYVAGQLVLIAVVFFGPRTLPGLAVWPAPLARISVTVGAALMLAGSGLLVVGLLWLGSNLTPLPYPRPHAILVQTRPYRLVRHPMYVGGIVLAYVWALVVRGWLTLVYATVLFVFLDVKSTREERWLADKFPDYPDYKRRVRKLIPFIH
jgi:protein-S-isoprenylcysteine O-methyltransferase Ste14